MDEVSEKTGVTLKSCRRQYDNVKRVFKVVEDLPGSLVTNIRQHFLLSEDLAKYIEINFIFNNIIFNRILYVYNFIYIYIYIFKNVQTLCSSSIHSLSQI